MGYRNFEKWARVYDIIYSDYKEDIKFYTKEALKENDKVLEIACGTGRIYLELLKKGVDAYGIDISQKMIDTLKKKAGEQNLKPKVKQSNMKNFNLNHKFSLIIIPFRSYLHNLTTDDQLNTLKNIKRHLKPGGRLILNFFFPNPEIITNTYGKEISETIKSGNTSYTLSSTSYFVNEPEQIVEFTNTLKEKGEVIWEDKFQLALIYKKEFELLLRLAGFKDWKVYAGFDCRPLTSYKQEMVWIIGK
ncbi:MAG: class I SAM-dependent methyltransferase [Candidatus Nanoarchaeia archaeon]